MKTFANGVRVGNVDNHKKKNKRSGIGQAWFPKDWKAKDIRHAGNHVASLKGNRNAKDGTIVWGVWKGVRVGVIRTHGKIATIFPDNLKQPNKRSKSK